MIANAVFKRPIIRGSSGRLGRPEDKEYLKNTKMPCKSIIPLKIVPGTLLRDRYGASAGLITGCINKLINLVRFSLENRN